MKKQINIELLRIISILMVISIHVLSEVHIVNTNLLYIEAFMKVSVPCFFMIMGYLFYEDKDIKKTWLSGIKRFLIPLVGFFVFYEFIYAYFFSHDAFTFSSTIKKLLTTNLVYTHAYHLWFIWDAIILYLLYPIIKKIIKNKKLLNSLIIILFIISIVLNTWSRFSNDFLYYFNFDYQLLYFLIGYKLKNIDIKINSVVLFCLYVFMIFSSIFLYKNFEYYNITNLSFINSFSYDSIFIFFASIFFFLLFLKINLKNHIIEYLGSKTLGIYYIHLFYLFVLLKFFIAFFFSHYYIVIFLIYILSLITVSLFDKIKIYFRNFCKRIFEYINNVNHKLSRY